MNSNIRIIFFGSTSDSVLVLNTLFNLQLISIVTQPPKPVGRKQILTPTPVELYAREKNIPVLTFPSQKEKPWLYENEETVINTLESEKPDLLISACYGQKIPYELIQKTKYGGLNVHPSLLPRWRGADPVPWTILTGDKQTGVTIVTLEEKFDQGKILAQKKIPITNNDMSDPLRTKLFSLGATLLIDSLPTFLASKGDALQATPVQGSPDIHNFYARRLTRVDGFIPWEKLHGALQPQGPALNSKLIFRMFRALTPWPGIWTEINPTLLRLEATAKQANKPIEKRVKILEMHQENEKLIIDTVQVEGKKSVSWKQFSSAYLTPN